MSPNAPSVNIVNRVTLFAFCVFKSDRGPVALVLLGIMIACWAWILPMAHDMQGSMSGSSAWMMTAKWDSEHLFLLCAMWTVMMIGMMLPSVTPAVLDLVRLEDSHADGKYAARTGFAFMAGYIVAWSGFSVLLFLIHRFLDATKILSPMMEIRSTRLSIVLLAAASAYQFTPLKRACLKSCRCLTANSSDPGFQAGLQNGLHCLGCCWALMLLLFVGGVMNLWWIVGLSAFVFFEKMAGPGWQRACAVVLPAVGSGVRIVSMLVGI